MVTADGNNSQVMIDNMIVRAHQQAGARNKGGVDQAPDLLEIYRPEKTLIIIENRG